MSEDQKKQLHPIVEKAIQLAYEEFETIQFDDYAIEQLEDILKEYYGKEGLPEAILELIRLAVELGEKGCTSASLKILTVATSVADALKNLKNETIDKRVKVSKLDLDETQK
jgi:uncharacterized protein YajQ (UPF0234 family)